MAERNTRGTDERELGSMTQKAATLAEQRTTDEDLALINQFALSPLTADEVFTFKAVLCDNKLDRHFDRFTVKALEDLRGLFLGKTVIKDHDHRAANQVARIYKTELITSATEMTEGGELLTQLVAHCYMVKTASNADLIAEIKGGIKKEGSVGFRVSGAICSICGTDNAKSYCRHWPGRSYEKDGGPVTCTFTLTGASDAYEFSLVAVPAQRGAGVTKGYTGELVFEEKQAEPEAITPEEDPETPAEPAEPETTDDTQKELELRMRYLSQKARANKNTTN